MAVYAAHLTRTLQGTPSIFQVTAQEALGDTVKPALRKVIEYLSATYPNKCGWSHRWFDELYLVLDGLLQYHYLKHYAASFSESFYNLVRTPIRGNTEFSSGTRLPVNLERASLVLLIIVPYVRDKLHKIIERWMEDRDDGRLSKSYPDRARAAAVKLYSILYFLLECSRMYQRAVYMCGVSSCPAVTLRLLGLTLKDAPAVTPEADEHGWRHVGEALVKGKLRDATITFPMLGALVLRGVEYGAFLVQFLKWWESRGLQQQSDLPVPSPPERDARSVRYMNKCPICLNQWKTPTVLPVSGYIFCYTCISREVRSRHKCPVSGLPATEDTLVRMYLSDT